MTSDIDRLAARVKKAEWRAANPEKNRAYQSLHLARFRLKHRSRLNAANRLRSKLHHAKHKDRLNAKRRENYKSQNTSI